MAAAFLVPWKAATAHGEPELAVLVMLATAAMFNSGLALVQTVRKARSPTGASWRTTGWVALVFALLTLVGNHASAHAISLISGALLAVVQRCEVLLVAVVGALLLRESVRPAFWIGSGIAVLGLWVLEQPGTGGDAFDPLGVLMGLGSAACFGSMVLLARGYSERLHLLPFNAIRLWLSVGLWFAVERRLPGTSELPAGLLLNAGLAGFFGPFLARLSLLLSARHLPANVTALTALATPIMTLGMSYLTLGNLPTTRELLGGGIMLVGIAVPLLAVAVGQRLVSRPAGS